MTVRLFVMDSGNNIGLHTAPCYDSRVKFSGLGLLGVSFLGES